MVRPKFVAVLGWFLVAGSLSHCAKLEGDDLGPQLPTDGVSVVPSSSVTISPSVQNPNATTVPSTPLPVVTDGTISSKFDPYSCLDLPRDVNTNIGTVAQLFACNKTLTQRVLYNPNQQLTNSIGTACLQMGTANAAKVGSISMAPCDSNKPTQKWARVDTRWVNGSGNFCLEHVDGQIDFGSPLQASACGTQLTQSWNYTTPYTADIVDPLAIETTVAGRCNPALYVQVALDANAAADFAKVVPDVQAAVRAAVQQDCNLIFGKASDVPINRDALRVLVTADANSTIKASAAKTITLPGTYFVQMSAAATPAFATGLINQAVASFYLPAGNSAQWMAEGVWWYTRLKSTIFPTSFKVKTESYLSGGYTAGFFFVWLEEKYPGIVKDLTHDLLASSIPLDVSWFQSRTTQPVTALWTAYLASF